MPGTNSKPDFLDVDGDGDKTEPMKEAASKDKAQKFKNEKMKEVMEKKNVWTEWINSEWGW